MKVALQQHSFNAEAVLQHWIEISEKGSKALILGQVQIPSIFALKQQYKPKRKASRQEVDVSSDSELER